MAVAELLLVLVLGAAGPSGLARSQPLLWMAGHAARNSVPMAVVLGAGAMRETTLSGPAAVLAPPPVTAASPTASP